jgi:hypothetical protein
MSSKLDVLANSDNRRRLLLAEVAGLLHNIGKLDPNFLAGPTRGQGEVKAHFLDCQPYDFERFAKPDIGLINPVYKDLVRPDVNLTDSACTELLEKAHFEQQIADLGLSRAKVMPALEAFCKCLTRKGPLYFADVAVRKRLSQQEQQIQSKVQAEIDSHITPPQRQQHRETQLQQECKEQRNDLYQREEQEQEVREQAFRDIRLEVRGEDWPLADLLTLFWDHYFDKSEDDYRRRSTLKPWLRPDIGTDIPRLLILAHGEMSGGGEAWFECKR